MYDKLYLGKANSNYQRACDLNNKAKIQFCNTHKSSVDLKFRLGALKSTSHTNKSPHTYSSETASEQSYFLSNK